MDVQDVSMGILVVQNLHRIGKEMPSRSQVISSVAWKVGYAVLAPDCPPSLMHFVATNIPLRFRIPKVIDFVCQCIVDSSLGLQNRLALLTSIARETKLPEIWIDYIVPSIGPDDEKYRERVMRLLVDEELVEPLRMLLENFPDKLFAAAVLLPPECDETLPLAPPYDALRSFARNLTLPLRSDALGCSLATFNVFLEVIVESAIRQMEDNNLPLEESIVIMAAIVACGEERDKLVYPGLMEALVACYRIFENWPDKILLEQQKQSSDSYLRFLHGKFKLLTKRLRTEWKDDLRPCTETVVHAIKAFARLEMDGTFEHFAPLLGLRNFLLEPFPKKCLSSLTISLIQYVNTTNQVMLWRVQCAEAVLPHLPMVEGVQKLFVVLAKLRLNKGAWIPDLPQADISWQQLTSGVEPVSLPTSEYVSRIYLSIYATGFDDSHERAAAAIYTSLLVKDKSLLWPAAKFVNTFNARRALEVYLETVNRKDLPDNRLLLAKILCGHSVPNNVTRINFNKEDVLTVSYELQYQKRDKEAARLIIQPDLAQKFRIVSLRRIRKEFAPLERLVVKRRFDVLFWRTAAQDALNIPSNVDFWDVAETAQDKCQALLYLAENAKRASAGLGAALRCLELCQTEEIAPWLVSFLRKKCLTIIKEKYVSIGLVDWAVRYGWKLAELSGVIDLRDEEDTQLEFSQDDLLRITKECYEYLKGRAPLIRDYFGILELERIMARGDAKRLQAAAKKCLSRIWHAVNRTQYAPMHSFHAMISFISCIITPFCAFCTVRMIYEVRRVQNTLQSWPSAEVMQKILLKSSNRDTLVPNGGQFSACTCLLHVQEGIESFMDLVFVTRVFAATESNEQKICSWCIRLPVRTIAGFIERLNGILEINEKTAKQSLQKAETDDSDELRERFWNDRRNNDVQIENLVQELSDSMRWLTYLLAGIPAVGWSDALKMADDDPVVAMLICGFATAEDISCVKEFLQFDYDEEVILDKARKWNDAFPSTSFNQNNRYRNRVALFLDEEMCKLPVEMMKGVETTPFVRSIHHRIPPEFTSEASSGYYVLNPDGSLPRQDELLDLCKTTLQWQGRHLEEPTAREVYTNLSNTRVFLYAGHNAGERFISLEEIQKGPEKIASWNSSVLLMGCHTANTRKDGNNATFNPCFHYLIGGCPFVVGNLWGVLSNDCDSICKSVLKLWTVSNPKSGVTPHLDIALAMSRRAPKFRFLTGASAVCFGGMECGSTNTTLEPEQFRTPLQKRRNPSDIATPDSGETWLKTKIPRLV